MSDPFAPIASSAPAAATQACSRCGAPMDPTQATYSESGVLICKRCEALQTIDTGNERAVSSILGAGVGAFATGAVSFCFNPIFLFSVLAVLAGIGAIVMALRHPEYKQQMGWRYPATIAGGALGAGLGLLSAAIQLLANLLILAN